MTKDPRDPVGNNPTGRARKSSSRSRRNAANRLNRDLNGTRWSKPKDPGKDK